ncbi:MAG: hypothetical protein AABM64_13910 [Pseudomonadota bacterium]
MDEVEKLQKDIRVVQTFLKEEEALLTSNPTSRERAFFLHAKKVQLSELEKKLQIVLKSTAS